MPTKSKKGSEVEYVFHYARTPIVKIGQHVSKGDFLTDGSADLEELFVLAGKEQAQEYIIAEAKKIYELQGENVSRKHLEVVVREMFGRVRVTEAGDTPFAVGDYVEKFEFDQINRRTKMDGGIEAKANPVVMGIAEASLQRTKFPFCCFIPTHKPNVSRLSRLTGIRSGYYGKTSIIGRLIPAGTGFKGSKEYEMIEEFKAEANP